LFRIAFEKSAFTQYHIMLVTAEKESSDNIIQINAESNQVKQILYTHPLLFLGRGRSFWKREREREK